MMQKQMVLISAETNLIRFQNIIENKNAEKSASLMVNGPIIYDQNEAKKNIEKFTRNFRL